MTAEEYHNQENFPEYKFLGRKKTPEKSKFLKEKPRSCLKQLYIKDTKIPAHIISYTMRANNMTVEQIAEDYDLPIEVCLECIKYSSDYADFINEENQKSYNEMRNAICDMVLRTKKGKLYLIEVINESLKI